MHLQSNKSCLNKNISKTNSVNISDILSEKVGSGETINEVLTQGLVKLCREKPVGLDSIEFLGKWLIENNPNRPSVNIPDEE